MKFKKATLLFVCMVMIISVFAHQNVRIVSLVPSLTQSLYYLGVQEKLVGCTNYCVEGVADNKEIVASPVTVNIERVVALRPGLVLASNFTHPETIATLQRFGMEVKIFDSPKSFDEICEQFIELGVLVGAKENAERIVSESRRRVEAVSAKISWQRKPKMFFQLGANPLFSVTPNTFMDDYIQLLGAQNIAQNLRQGTVSREFVIAQNPDIIIVVTMGIVGEDERNAWMRHTGLSAVRNRQIHIIDSDVACQPTPINFARTMELLYRLITD